MQIQAVLRYYVADQPFLGLLRTTVYKEESAWQFINDTPKPAEIILRYDPRDPSCYRALPSDSPASPGLHIAIY